MYRGVRVMRLKIKGEIVSPWKTVFSRTNYVVQKSFVITDKWKSPYNNLLIQLILLVFGDSVKQIGLKSDGLFQKRLKSIKVTVTLFCCFLKWFSMWLIPAICSNVQLLQRIKANE